MLSPCLSLPSSASLNQFLDPCWYNAFSRCHFFCFFCRFLRVTRTHSLSFNFSLFSSSHLQSFFHISSSIFYCSVVFSSHFLFRFPFDFDCKWCLFLLPYSSYVLYRLDSLPSTNLLGHHFVFLILSIPV